MDTLLPVAPKVRCHARGWRVAVSLLALLLVAPSAFAGTGSGGKAVAPIIAQIDAGHFKAADAAITGALAQPGLSADTRHALAFQRERMRRILLDFTLGADEVKARVRQQIPDLSDAEFAKWNAAGLFEHQVIDGRTLYFKRSPGNLFRLSPEAVARRAVQTPIGDGPMEALNEHQRAIYQTALAGHKSSVLPRRLRMTQTLTVDADAVPAGETVRAWIPYPQAVPGQQEDIRYVASVPATHQIAPASAPQRTVYLEKPAVAGQKTVFSVTYELTLFAQYHAIDPARVTAEKITPELAPFVAERAPHIVFTDAMRAFSRKVVGEEKNPYRIAQKLFAAVDQIPWAGAREYSTISNISDYALHAGHADCGQQTLLLMTLLRLNGIPARWQSGMVYSDDGSRYSNIHDWGYLYLPPYGWVPMDVTTGRLHPAAGDDKALEWFYLGGLDNWRIAFNDDYGRRFQPSKRQFRSDDVDSQRGEAEWRGGNLYFDQLDYGFDWQVLPAAQGRSGN
ncbi:transglutaminase-like domain-containing protein [Rhodanobacter denitrificans]|uniref:Transglutaminase-like enzyme, predicted cysteine protease n=1 Tax=Rhodanobacter denitrificans TaxID=666685 RepID=M4NLF7_9GAMM|nr:transglutaminase domain-containing protein [Rhodanobacter denitrificans]AGG90473.1 transglutaminase-like enzyme, predicted cysteine protease [Rhodanobacter denitrificans]UJJ57248.1 transglutaminase domain-containing protein [Rhodanobacter denitrificans]UJM85857.1 transglutaminase domain-containing protein [Rhodanobacter denitrificans]